jgi:hypothetical protein
MDEIFSDRSFHDGSKKQGDRRVSGTMIQTIIWIAAGAALVMLLMRRRGRKVVR